MKNHKLKDLVSQIQKMAQSLGEPDFTPSTGGAAPAPKVVPHGQGGPSPVVGPIKNMQAAMQEFAAAVTKYSFKKPTKPGEKAALDDSKKPFNDFITETYMMDSPIKGQEYSTDPARQKQQEKQPTDLIEMNNVIDGLRRIGSPDRPGMSGNELKADNTWDFRTNNALKNIYAFAYALVNLSKDFGRTNVNSFSEADLSRMADAIPKEENPSALPAADKINKAKTLVPLIKKLTTFYQYYVDAIANHPGFVRFIIGEQPLMTIKPGGGDPLAYSDQEKQALQKIDSLTVDFGKGPIPLSVLQTPELFVNYLAENMKMSRNAINRKDFLVNILNQIVAAADQKIQQAQPKQVAAPAKQEQPDAGSPSGTGGVKNVPA